MGLDPTAVRGHQNTLRPVHHVGGVGICVIDGGGVLLVLQWNIERGYKLAATIEELLGCDAEILSQSCCRAVDHLDGGHGVVLLQWNIERGHKLDAVIKELRACEADVIALQEVDMGCERSGEEDIGWCQVITLQALAWDACFRRPILDTVQCGSACVSRLQGAFQRS